MAETAMTTDAPALDHWAVLRHYVQRPAAPEPEAEPATEPQPERQPETERPRRGRRQAEPEPEPGASRRPAWLRAPNFARPLIDAVANAPTPGDLLPLLGILLFFLFAIVPVGPRGTTRLELIWRALTGGLTLPTSPQAAAEQQTLPAEASAFAGNVGITLGQLWAGAMSGSGGGGGTGSGPNGPAFDDLSSLMTGGGGGYGY